MSMDKKIPYPRDEEMDHQIAFIVKQGLPKKQSFFGLLRDMKQQIGWHHLLLDRVEALFSGLVVFVEYSYLWMTSTDLTVHSLTFYSLVFMLAPLVFLSLSGYAYYQKQSNNTFELEMTMKYTVFQMNVFRMILFSGLAIIVNMTFLLMLSLKVDFDVWRVLMLSLTGLFLFAAGLLLFIHKGNILLRSALFIGTWIMVNLLLLALVEKQYEQLLERLPIAVYGVILIGCLSLYTVSLARLFNRKQEEYLC